MIRVIGFGSWRMPVTPTEATGIAAATPATTRRCIRDTQTRNGGRFDILGAAAAATVTR